MDQKYRNNYAIGQSDALYGVAIEDANKHGHVKVEDKDGNIHRAIHVHAYDWGGWVPDGLESVIEKYQQGLHEEHMSQTNKFKAGDKVSINNSVEGVIISLSPEWAGAQDWDKWYEVDTVYGDRQAVHVSKLTLI